MNYVQFFITNRTYHHFPRLTCLQTLSSLLSGGSLAALARDDLVDLMEKEPAPEGRSLDSGPLLQVLGGVQEKDTAGEKDARCSVLHW